MARRVYFSFHYEADVWRTNQVRNSWVAQGREAAGFHDAAEFEEVKKGGDAAISRWIDRNLDGTTVTVVCVGENTCNRPWVREEIRKSIARGNAIVFIKIHNLKDQNGNTCPEGAMDFGDIDVSKYPVYDWDGDDGYHNIGDWVNSSVEDTNRPQVELPPRKELGPSNKRYTTRSSCGRSCQPKKRAYI